MEEFQVRHVLCWSAVISYLRPPTHLELWTVQSLWTSSFSCTVRRWRLCWICMHQLWAGLLVCARERIHGLITIVGRQRSARGGWNAGTSATVLTVVEANGPTHFVILINLATLSLSLSSFIIVRSLLTQPNLFGRHQWNSALLILCRSGY